MSPTSVTFGNALDKPALVFEQRTYSTADVEHAVFYGEARDVEAPSSSAGAAMLLVVNGEFFELNEESSPMPWRPLTPDSGLLRLAEPLDS
jgi:hypothetical protein